VYLPDFDRLVNHGFMTTKSFRTETSFKVYSNIGDAVRCMIEHGIPEDMTMKELLVLNKLTLCFMKHDTLTQWILVEETGLSKVTISRLVFQWLQAGWLTETIDPDDRRVHLLRLSEFAYGNSDSLVRTLLRQMRKLEPLSKIFRSKSL